MSRTPRFTPDPRLDLVFERVVDLPRDLIWRAWTTPDLVTRWFTPAPWQTVTCEIDLRPGGIFRTTMRSPEGEVFPHLGCYLEIVPHERLVWTNALAPDYRPTAPGGPGPSITAIIALEAQGQGTRYRATALHADAAARAAHEAMGFQEGWGKALDQLVAAMKGR